MGFGRGKAQAQGLAIVVEAASVNRHRLDVQVSLLRNLMMLEPELFQRVPR
jgi:uncharacterized protein YicC (UPF0701 family)